MRKPQPPKKHRSLGAPDRTIKLARRFRQEMSLPDVLLWQQLKTRPGGHIFRNQHSVGPNVLDFACIRARLDIEVDGEAHNRGDWPLRDAVRNDWLERRGFQTLRLPAKPVFKNLEEALVAIVVKCNERAMPHQDRNR